MHTYSHILFRNWWACIGIGIGSVPLYCHYTYCSYIICTICAALTLLWPATAIRPCGMIEMCGQCVQNQYSARSKRRKEWTGENRVRARPGPARLWSSTAQDLIYRFGSAPSTYDIQSNIRNRVALVRMCAAFESVCILQVKLNFGGNTHLLKCDNRRAMAIAKIVQSNRFNKSCFVVGAT